MLGWLNRSTGNAWNTAGALGSGTDIVSGKSFTINVAATGDQTWTIPLDLAVVQGWMNNASADQGVLLHEVTDDQYVDFYTSENATTSNRPLLSITYTPGGGQSPIRMGPELLALAAPSNGAKNRSAQPLALSAATGTASKGNDLAKFTSKGGIYKTIGGSQDDGSDLSTI